MGPKTQSCPLFLKIGTYSILTMLIPNPDLDFLIFDPKIHGWENVGPKRRICLFCLKIDTGGISKMLVLVSTLAFRISNPNFFFGTNSEKKVKVVPFK